MHDGNNILFHVDETSDLPIWVQLRNRMSYLIGTGQLAAGEQLPSIRSLSAQAKINYNTVAKAYRDLELSGLVVSIRGRGMFVQKDVSRQNLDTSNADILLENCVEELRAKGMAYSEIAKHVLSKIDDMKAKATSLEREKEGYSHGA